MKTLNKKQIIAHVTLATGDGISALCLKHEVHRATMYRAINGEIDSPKCRKIISDTIHLPEREIWGEQSAQC